MVISLAVALLNLMRHPSVFCVAFPEGGGAFPHRVDQHVYDLLLLGDLFF